MNPSHDLFNEYIQRWDLKQDGNAIITNSSQLLPVIYQDINAMLKVALSNEERIGAQFMLWWDGKGAARVLQHHDKALLLERAVGKQSLVDMTNHGADDRASQIICQVVAQLHATNKPLAHSAVPLVDWFQSLIKNQQHELLHYSAQIAAKLLANQQDLVILHGDIHHQNILDFDERGWLAIDPKGLIGDRAFDYANLFCNPNQKTATAAGRLRRQLAVVSEAAGIEPLRLLKWICAYAGLSAAWFMEEGHSAELPLKIVAIAKAELQYI